MLALAFCVALLGLLATPATRSASASACGKWGDAEPTSLSAGEARKAVMCLINKERDEAGLKSLDRNQRLQRAAQGHNEKMDGSGCFAHACPGERDLGARLDDVNYLAGGLREWAFGEIIAWGMRNRGTPEAVVDAWMRSPGHRANILNRSFRDLGVGFSAGTPNGGGEPGGIYTVDFGLRVG